MRPSSSHLVRVRVGVRVGVRVRGRIRIRAWVSVRVICYLLPAAYYLLEYYLPPAA